jgi:hypothetical protein
VGSQKHQMSGLGNKHIIIMSIISSSGTCHTVILCFLTIAFAISILQLNKVEKVVSYTMSPSISKKILILYNSPNSYHILLVFYSTSSPIVLQLLKRHLYILYLDSSSICLTWPLLW